MESDPKPSPGDAESAVYQMLWDCEYCGTRKLLGLTHRFCPQCGAGQNPQKRYFPPDDEKIAVQDHPYCGADRLCPSCRNPGSAKTLFCGQCGTPLEQAAAVKTQADQIRLAGSGEFTGLAIPAAKAQAAKPNSRRWLGVALVLAVLALAWIAFSWTETVALKLDHFGWERTVNIESFLPRQQGAWCDAMPADAYAVSRRQEVRSQRQVPDGETCNTRRIDRGDGTYAEKQECTPKYRNEPVYGEYCNFTVNRWAPARSVATGAQDQTPYWGEVRLNGNGEQCLGCERETSRQESLYLYFKSAGDKPKEYRCPVPTAQWQAAQTGSAWSMEQGKLLGEARCGSLKPRP